MHIAYVEAESFFFGGEWVRVRGAFECVRGLDVYTRSRALDVHRDVGEKLALTRARCFRQEAVWRNGSASDPRSEGWEFESLCGHMSRWELDDVFAWVRRGQARRQSKA